MKDLSDGALRILRHFKENSYDQQVYEYPTKLEALFDGPETCEQAQAELAILGLIDLGPERHYADPSGVRAAALTREGARYIKHLP
ncbi:MAG: hypothetical protein JO264_22170 [Acidisphaera sp.]|nr:hypothetical protein [Acidisphaera sp.]